MIGADCMQQKFIDNMFKWMKKYHVLTKIMIGFLLTIIMILYVSKDILASGETMDAIQWGITIGAFFYVCFGIPWGFAKLRIIQYEPFSKIPIIGFELYLIMKLGLSCICGTPIMFYELLTWITNQTRSKSEYDWLKSELKLENKSSVDKYIK